ncbi:hypothetical protein [Geodermatophilus chilensis]|uniref:hypothetical protein n=1 Tax=Geodermatophilus chilensis TaxID=2035835 RepID=UPI000C2646BA|nr:hypothetical protein [Geodermatophilus chilensis]
MSDNYWRQRLDDQLAAAENARAARMRALDEALQAVRAMDEDVMDAEDLATLNQAQAVVNDLRRTW